MTRKAFVAFCTWIKKHNPKRLMNKLLSSTVKTKGNAGEKKAMGVSKSPCTTQDLQESSTPKSPSCPVKIQEVKVNVEEKMAKDVTKPSHTQEPKTKESAQWSKKSWPAKVQEVKSSSDQEKNANEIIKPSHIADPKAKQSAQWSKKQWPVKIQLASDIHLEQNPGMKFQDIIVPSADIFILAGDIGCPNQAIYKDFIKECHLHFKHTILIAGNHEYRRSMPKTMEQVDEDLDNMCKQYPNVYYLAHGANKVVWDINFIGATMWTPIEDKHFSKDQISSLNHSMSQQKINAKTPFGVKESNAMHRRHLASIDEKITWGLSNGKRNVVITHHAPLIDGPFWRKDLPGDYLYGTDLSGIMDGKRMRAWFYGHTHTNHAKDINGVFVASNQYGGHGVKAWSKTFTTEV
jgi:predicted phosphodiesterase